MPWVAGEPGSVLGRCPGSPLCASCASKLTPSVEKQAQACVSKSSSGSILSRIVVGGGVLAREQWQNLVISTASTGAQPCHLGHRESSFVHHVTGWKGAHSPFYVPQNRSSSAQVRGTALALTGQNRSVWKSLLCFLSWSWWWGKAYKQKLVSDKQRISQHLFGFRKCNHLCYYHKTNIWEVLPVFSELLKAIPENDVSEK